MFQHYVTSVAVGDRVRGRDDDGHRVKGLVTAIRADDDGAKHLLVGGAWYRFQSPSLTLVSWTPAAGSSFEDSSF